MAWLKVSWVCSQSQMDGMEGALYDLGVVSIGLSSADDIEILEPGVDETPQWPNSTCEALFPLNVDLDRLHELLRQNDVETVDVRFIEQADWNNLWREDVRAMSFGRISVVPRDSCTSDPCSIKLDPGLAFGTGRHPTTSMCLKWLDSKDLRNKRVLDFGCGSGILSIAAAKLGASKIVAIDHDPQALEASRANAAFNNVIVDVCATVTEGEQFNFVVANILANTLVEHAQLLQKMIPAGGEVALSGLLPDQFELVRPAYQEIFFSTPVVEDGWMLMSGIKQ